MIPRGLRALIAVGLALSPMAAGFAGPASAGALTTPAPPSPSPTATPTAAPTATETGQPTPASGSTQPIAPPQATLPSQTTGPPATTTTSAPISVRLTTLRPVAPQPGDTLTIAGSVTNDSSEPVSDLGVSLRMSGALLARSEFDEYAADPTAPLPDNLTPITQNQPLRASTLAPQTSELFRIELPIDQLDLSSSTWEIRELGIAVNGLTTSSEGVVGQLRTFLPWAPRSALGFQPLQLAWVWPLIDRPHREVSAIWRDDTLAAEVGSGGRLATLVGAAAAAKGQGDAARQAAAVARARRRGPQHRHKARPVITHVRNVPVTWAIDPMLIDDVTAMRSGYQVAHGVKPVAGRGSGAARSWLAAARAAVGSDDVIPLPYADPDIAAAVRNGLSTLVGLAATTGRTLLSRTFPAANELSTAWPFGGLLDDRSVEALFADGITSLVLSDTAIPLTTPPNETPSARSSLSTDEGDLPVALSDSTVSNAVDAGAGPHGDQALAVDRYLAETLMIEAEAPGDSPDKREVVVTPSRRWDPSAQYADALLADTGKVPWLQPVTLTHVLNSPVDDVVRKQLDYPGSARRAELPAAYLDQLRTIQTGLGELTNILPPGSTDTRPFGTAVLRALSTAWRQEPLQRGRQVAAVRASLDKVMAAVHISSAGDSFVTLTSHGGKVPVSIANDLDSTVTVRALVDANQRLTLSKGGKVGAQSIPAHQQITVNVHANAKTSGVFPLTVQLLTPDGQKYGKRVQLYVRSTAYGTITLVITAAATIALLVAVAIRLGRRALAARR